MRWDKGAEKDRRLAAEDSTLRNDGCHLEEQASTKFSFSSTFWVGSDL